MSEQKNTHLIRVDSIHWLRFLSLFLAVAIGVIANGFQGILVPVSAQVFGMHSLAISMMSSAFYAGYFIGTLLAVRLVTRVGHIRSFAVLASIVSGASLVFILAQSEAMWIFLRLLCGACFAGMVVIVESWINAATSKELRAKTLAMYNIIVLVSWAASQWLLSAMSSDGLIPFVVVSILFSIALVPVALSKADGPVSSREVRLNIRQVVTISPSGLAGIWVLGAMVASTWGVLPIWAASRGLDTGSISLLFSASLVMAILMQWPLGHLSDRMSRAAVVMASYSVASLLMLMATIVPSDNVAYTVLTIGLSAGLVLPCYSILVAMANDNVEQDQVVALSSSLVLVYGAGAIAGPLITGMVYSYLGDNALFISISLLLGLGVLSIKVLKIMEPPALTTEKKRFVAVPTTSQGILPLHENGDAITMQSPHKTSDNIGH